MIYIEYIFSSIVIFFDSACKVFFLQLPCLIINLFFRWIWVLFMARIERFIHFFPLILVNTFFSLDLWSVWHFCCVGYEIWIQFISFQMATELSQCYVLKSSSLPQRFVMPPSSSTAFPCVLGPVSSLFPCLSVWLGISATCWNYRGFRAGLSIWHLLVQPFSIRVFIVILEFWFFFIKNIFLN